MKTAACQILATVTSLLLPLVASAAWQPAKGPLNTRWTSKVSPHQPLPEYPRPQLVRSEWLNLNGLWDFAISRQGAKAVTFQQQILVPFPVESALSGVMKPVNEDERLWYRRFFTVPKAWRGRRVLLNFGAVDFEATVWVNGKNLGQHRGGYDSFSFDLTDVLKPSEQNELVVCAWDPTDAGTQSRGKQVRKPNGIWYTPTSGIWQTVWLEPVNGVHITGLEIVPDIDKSEVVVQPSVTATAGLGGFTVEATARDGLGRTARVSASRGKALVLPISKPRLWSPEDPRLYRLEVTLKLGARSLDHVASYFGMRKISLGKDPRGFTRLMLNNKPYFQFGPLDQGFWPDGLYTAPTDAALRYDIEMTKKLGFNLARKHVKVEPDRWYYWCDRLGLLVWQDMPSGDRSIGAKAPDISRSPESARQFEQDLAALVADRRNHPSIVMWVPYNEGWGQWDTPRIVDLIHALDPSRLVDAASGWVDRRVGDVNDVHEYPGPASPAPEPNRASVLGEFGGLGRPVRGHAWQSEKNWGYRNFTNAAALTSAYTNLVARLLPLIEEKGLTAAVYTQTTDVEIEVNGLMTYDRDQVKMNWSEVAAANQSILPTAARK
jgi:beta-galactosidase/beta-glucuronidase